MKPLTVPKLHDIHVHVAGNLGSTDEATLEYRCCLNCDAVGGKGETGLSRILTALTLLTGMSYGQGCTPDQIHAAVTQGIVTQVKLLRANNVKPAP